MLAALSRKHIAVTGRLRAAQRSARQPKQHARHATGAAEMNAALLLQGLMAANAAGDVRIHGVVIGVVTDNCDPEGLHRVKLHFPWLSADEESYWARIATPMAGKGRGFYTLPEVDDEVLVAFEHGSVDHPFVIGALWNGKDTPPEDNGNRNNDHRSLTSRSGHVLRLNDASGQETVEIIDKTGNNRIVIETASNKVRIEAQGDIEISSSTGKVKISGVGIELSSTTDVKVRAQTTLDMEAQAQASLQAALVKIN
jgi:uncharacterized protein involved in type VI secretion and phage assembly